MREPLKTSTTLAYAFPGFALTVLTVPLLVYAAKFYTDVVRVPVAAVGAVLMVGRFVDAFTDPAMGILSDHTRTRWGRRKPYMVLGVIPLAAATAMVLVPPVGMGPVAGTVWFAGAVALFQLSWTVTLIPYEALGVEISSTYDERTRLFGWRDGVALLGVLAAVVTPPLIGRLLPHAGERDKYVWFAVVWIPVGMVSVWLCARVAKERAATALAAPLKAWREMLKNQQYRVLLTAYTLAGISAILQATLLLYFVPYVLGADRPDEFLLVYIGSGIVMAPILVTAAKKLEKRTVWVGSMLLITAAHLPVLFIPEGANKFYLFLCIASGAPMAAMIAMPAAMQADVIDYGERLYGHRQEGLYIGVWTITRKVSAAVGIGVALVILDFVGYIPEIDQTPAVRLTLRILYGLVPSVFYILACLVMLRYTITRDAHAAVREEIARG